MKAAAKAAALADTRVRAFAERLGRKRMALTDRPFMNPGTQRGLLGALGLSPSRWSDGDLALAYALREWRGLQLTFAVPGKYRGLSAAERCSAELEQLNSDISVLEYRLFGRNCGPAYPEFESMAAWLLWRLPAAYPGEHFTAGQGWSPEFIAFAHEDSQLSV